MAARREHRMKYRVKSDFNAGWARAKAGDTVELTEEQGRLLAFWVEPIATPAPAPAPRSEPAAPASDDVPGAPPPVRNVALSSEKAGGNKAKLKKGRRRA